MLQKPSQHHYLRAVGYFLLSLCMSVSNDAISKYLVTAGFPAWEITFFRTSLGIIYLLAYGFYSWQLYPKPPFPIRQIIRGFLFGLASTLWVHGLAKGSISSATLISFSIPLFILLFSPILLKEKTSMKIWLFTIIGLIGVLVVLWPTLKNTITRTHTASLLGAVLLFALLDIINKKYVDQEPLFTIIFYPSCIALLFSIPSLSWTQWIMPTPLQWILLLLLGLGGNAIIYLLLNAYRLSPITSLAPLRYLELLLSSCVGYIVFKDIPGPYELVGAIIIIPAVCWVIYDQKKQKQS